VPAVTNAEVKLESQSSTLPRAGRSGKSLPLSAGMNMPSGDLPGSFDQQNNVAAAASEAPGISGKRRSAAHMYRMQTESSLAKVNAGKDSSAESSSSRGSSVSTKESYTMLRFPSTPNIAADDAEVNNGVEAAKSSHRPHSVEDADVSRNDHLKADNTSRLASMQNHTVDDSQLVDANDRTLMPPPLSTSVPLSYQATFIAKAAKHRRTTMPESLSRSRELLAGAIAKHHRLSESPSPCDGDDSPPSSLSALKSNVTAAHTQDTNRLEPPERDNRKRQNQVRSVQLTDPLAHNVSTAECANVTGIKAEYSDSVSSADSSVTGSPKVIKIGRCVSPVKPLSASSNNHRRQLPADPRQSHGSAEHTPALDSVTSCATPQSSVTSNASAETGIGLTESMQEISQSVYAGRLSTEASERHKSHVQPVTVPQQDGGQRAISSKTETRLVLSTEYDTSENLACNAQQTIINEIERYCTERRMSADLSSQLADDQEQRAASAGGHTRQQWEKPKSVQPLIVKSESNSSGSQTASVCDSSLLAASVCDSSVLADISSLSRNSVYSASSSSCLAFDVSAVTASISDSVISYRSSVQMPSKPTLTTACGATDISSPLHSNDTETVEDNHVSVLKMPTYTDSLLQPVSAMSSDK